MSKPQIRPTRRVRGRDLDVHRDMLAEADSDYGTEMRRLKLFHGRLWHRKELTGHLLGIEKRIKRHTKHLPKHPKGRTLPCWCQECVAE